MRPITLFLLTAICLFSCKKDKQSGPESSEFSVTFTGIDNPTFNDYNLKGSLSVSAANGQIEYGFLMGADSGLTVNNSTKIVVGKSAQSITFSLPEKALDTGRFLYFKAYAQQGSKVAYSSARNITGFTPAITYADSVVNNGYPISVYTNIPNLDPKATVNVFLNSTPVTILGNTVVNENQAAFILNYPTQLSPGDYTLMVQINGLTLTFRKKITLLTGKWQQLSNIPFSYPWLANKTVGGFFDNGWIYQYGWIRDGASTGTKAQFYRYNIQTQEQKVLTGFDPAGKNILLENPEIDFNGDIHFLGGETIPDANSVNTHYVYHTQSDSWTQEPNIPSGPRQDAVGFLYNNKIYFGLGYQAANTNIRPIVYQKFYNDFYSYDPVAKTWQQLASYPLNGTYYSTSFIIGSKIYVTGGVSTDDNGTSVKDTWCYDIPSNTWSKKTSFPGRADIYYYSFTIGNYAYVGGGQTVSYDSFGGPGYVVQCFRYDPVEDKWTEVSNMAVTMAYGINGTQGQTGIVAGGLGDNDQPLNVVYQFTP
jgi:hypothetical protein